MRNTKAFTVKYRRRREGRTDYRTRRDLVTSGKIRVVMRKSLNNCLIQMVKFETIGDKTLVQANALELVKLGWKGHTGNVPAAYLTGYMVGLKALKNGQKEGILDIGTASSVAGTNYYSAVKGLIDAGFKIACKETMIPKPEVISGKTIEEYAKYLASKDKVAYTKQFSKYIKAGLKPEELSKHFEDIKRKVKEKWH